MAWDASMINLDEAITRSMGRKELYKGWLDGFFRDETFEPVDKAFTNNDNTAAEAALHKLKGTAGNLAVKKVHVLAEDMCARVKAGETTDSMTGDLEKLREDFVNARTMYNDNIDELLNYGELIF